MVWHLFRYFVYDGQDIKNFTQYDGIPQNPFSIY